MLNINKHMVTNVDTLGRPMLSYYDEEIPRETSTFKSNY